MDDLITVPFFACFWCQVFRQGGFRCQFAGFSFLTPDTRNLSKIPSEAKHKRGNPIFCQMR